MILLVDFDPNAVYCGNVTARSIKIAVAIANNNSMYCLVMRGGDLVGGYLITRANPSFPVNIKTPQEYEGRPGFVIQATCNLYAFRVRAELLNRVLQVTDRSRTQEHPISQGSVVLQVDSREETNDHHIQR
jgi:hypothetical protein